MSKEKRGFIFISALIFIIILIFFVGKRGTYPELNKYTGSGLLKHIEMNTGLLHIGDAFVDKTKFNSLSEKVQLLTARDFYNYFKNKNERFIFVRIRDIISRKVIASYTSRTDEIIYPW